MKDGSSTRLSEALGRVADELALTRWAAALTDPQWNLVWVSDELKKLIGEHDETRLGYGKHVLDAWMDEVWIGRVARDSLRETALTNVPLMLGETVGGKDTIVRILSAAFGAGPDDFAELLAHVEPVEPPPLWSMHFDYVAEDQPPSRVNYVGVRMLDPDTGGPLGTVFIFGSGLPATVLDLVARGDEGMFDRMARLVEPGRRAAAIVFADLQESGLLSRRLPSAAFFGLIQKMTSSIDSIVVKHKGIAGKHAGDGVTAFFLADDLGSRSAAARAALAAAREIGELSGELAASLGADAPVESSKLRISVGAHWGGQLYMGQLVSGGRLEVTALGDTVNETARIQESAQGVVLASKGLLEHLHDDDARALGVDPDAVAYRTIAELPGASEKAKRDAGTLPVTVLR